MSRRYNFKDFKRHQNKMAKIWRVKLPNAQNWTLRTAFIVGGCSSSWFIISIASFSRYDFPATFTLRCALKSDNINLYFLHSTDKQEQYYHQLSNIKFSNCQQQARKRKKRWLGETRLGQGLLYFTNHFLMLVFAASTQSQTQISCLRSPRRDFTGFWLARLWVNDVSVVSYARYGVWFILCKSSVSLKK